VESKSSFRVLRNLERSGATTSVILISKGESCRTSSRGKKKRKTGSLAMRATIEAVLATGMTTVIISDGHLAHKGVVPEEEETIEVAVRVEMIVDMGLLETTSEITLVGLLVETGTVAQVEIEGDKDTESYLE
jgi:predicted ABC-type sugar transport system permease subunit